MNSVINRSPEPLARSPGCRDKKVNCFCQWQSVDPEINDSVIVVDTKNNWKRANEHKLLNALLSAGREGEIETARAGLSCHTWEYRMG